MTIQIEATEITITRKWLQEMVIKLNFCPFAAKPFNQNTIRFAVTNATDEKAVVDDLVAELALIRDADLVEIETTLFIVPDCFKHFSDYNQFINVVDAILNEMTLDGEFQVATFHPDYQFADLAKEDVRNYTNRSIYPMFHIIREASVEFAREIHPDVEAIPEVNMDKLQAMGIEAVKQKMTNIICND